ncbi:MAG: hypothetical protein ACRDHM_04210 [Actinomycetota bacterium]
METLILGFVLGLIAGPVIRSWIVWREYQAASREAWLADETLRRLEQERELPGREADELRPGNAGPDGT